MKTEVKKGASAEPSTAGVDAGPAPTVEADDGRQKPVTSGGRVEPDNTTTRPHDGEPPEDGSDVPTFDEYQRKFTSGRSQSYFFVSELFKMFHFYQLEMSDRPKIRILF